MTKLKLKPEFEGMIITRKHFVVGEITFNANQVPQDSYQNYSKSGFEDLFEAVEDDVKQIELTNDGEITGISFTDKPTKKPRKK